MKLLLDNFLISLYNDEYCTIIYIMPSWLHFLIAMSLNSVAFRGKWFTLSHFMSGLAESLHLWVGRVTQWAKLLHWVYWLPLSTAWLDSCILCGPSSAWVPTTLLGDWDGVPGLDHGQPQLLGVFGEWARVFPPSIQVFQIKIFLKI